MMSTIITLELWPPALYKKKMTGNREVTVNAM